MISECKYCTKRFDAKTYRKLFCSDRCKVRYNRESGMTCFYCGDLADSRDHVTPHSTTILRRRVWSNLDWVMCCRECNTLMGNMHPYSLSDRIAYLIERFTTKHKLDNVQIQWDDSELDDLGYSLRSYIETSMKQWNSRMKRLSHMRLRNIQVAHAEMECSDADVSLVLNPDEIYDD